MGPRDCLQPNSDKVIPSVKWVRLPPRAGHRRSQGLCLINSRFNICVFFSVFLSSKERKHFYTNLSLHLFRGNTGRTHTHTHRALKTKNLDLKFNNFISEKGTAARARESDCVEGAARLVRFWLHTSRRKSSPSRNCF